MQFDRQRFFEGYRLQFGRVSPEQTHGLERLLEGYETYYGWWDFIPQIANSLSQIKHETAHSFMPVVECYYLGNPKAPGFYTGNTDRVRRNQQALRYYPHFGRGDIQLTWLENYEEQDGFIRQYFPERVADFELRTGKTFNLAKYPEQALDPWISFLCMTIGMHKGTFREGHTLDRYINRKNIDHFTARNIVNGDRYYKMKGSGVRIGDQIAADARRFEAILNASLIEADAEDLLEVNTNSTAVVPAGTQAAYQHEPALNPVELPEPGADGSPEAPGAGELPVGDAPDVVPTETLNVEDWKGFGLRWLKRIWGFGIFGNMSQATAFAGAAVNDPERGHIYIGIAVVLFIVIAVIGLLATVGIVILLLWNRKEIGKYITDQWAAKMDPNRKNYALHFEKK